MKERIVIDFKDLKCAEDKNYVIAKKEKCKVEKYPTNWEELKELCKKLKLVVSKNVNMEKDNEYIVCCWMNFYEYGDILDSDGYAISENRTPQQMWQIIKNLIGEE